MGYSDEYFNLRKKRKNNTTTFNIPTKSSTETSKKSNSFTDEYAALKEKRLSEEIAPVKTTRLAEDEKFASAVEWLNKKFNTNFSTDRNDWDNPTKKKEWLKEQGISLEYEPVVRNGGGGTVFKAGGFSDGVDSVGDFFGDLGETILGTAGDLGLGLTRGLGGLGEGIVDLGMYGAAEIGEFFGADKFAKKTKKVAQKNAVRDFTQGAVDYVDQYSVLGDKSDAVTEGLGQVGGMLLGGWASKLSGLGAKGATALNMGIQAASGMGSGIGEAYAGNARDSEAWKYGLFKGGIDAGTELMFGGIGKWSQAIGVGKSGIPLDDILAKAATKNMTSRVAKNLTEYGIKATAEGIEEVVAGYLTAHAKKGTYMAETDFSDILEDENLLEQFIVGATVSAISQSGYVPGMKKGSLREANRTGRDFITGYTDTEQSIIDKEVERRVADKEKDGTKLTRRELGKIEEQVKNSLERGEISTDTIEEMLGGETYEAYKKAKEQETADLKELAELYEGEELQQQIENYLANSKLGDMQKQLSNEVFGQVKDSYLAESYVQREKRKTAFKADLSQYDEKYQATIKKAVESGILNDTRQTHDFVDLVAKISADKGVNFDFTNNERIKNSRFAVEGKVVNGYVDKATNTIGLNIESNKALEKTVGHEITHILEGTDLYDTFQEAAFEYAKSKKATNSKFANEYLERLYNAQQLYKDIEGYQGAEGFAEIKKEVTADLVGDYIFTDEAFVRNLSINNRNVFEKVYDEIKYLCKVATAGSKEARQLEKVKKTFDAIYRESGSIKAEKTESTGKVKHSVSEDSNGNELSIAVQKRFANSKAVDENGNLKVLYHGTVSGEFYTFDKSKGSVEGDFGSGFYFTDSEYDVENNYEDGGADFDNKVARRAEQIEQEEGIDYYEAEARAWEELYKGGFRHTVYLNIENPAIVGETNLLDYESFAEEYDREDYDSDEDYESDVEYLIQDQIDSIIWDIDRNIDIYSTDGIAEVLWEAVNEGGIDIERLKAKINKLYLEDNNGNLVGNEVTRQIIESLGYDGIIDPTVSGKWNMDMEEGTTHYIVFKPNQIKSIDNQNPTDNPDIRYSVSEEGLENIGNILYNKKSPMSIVNRAKSNNNSSINWVYRAEVFSVTENILFHEKIGEINQGSRAFQKSSNDEYMLPIENKIVFTDGNYDSPYISEVVEILTEHQTEFEYIKERIFNVEKGKSSKQDAVQTIRQMFGDGIVITYRSGNDGVYGWEDGRRKGKTRRTVVRNYLNKHYGRGNDSQINETATDLIGTTQEGATNQIAPVKETSSADGVFFDTKNHSLSNESEQPIKHPNLTYGEDVKLDIAPTREDIVKNVTPTQVEDIAPMPTDADAPITAEEANAQASESFEYLTDADAPPELDTEYYNTPDTNAVDNKTLKNIGKALQETLSLTSQETKAIQEIVQEYSTTETLNKESLFDKIKKQFGEKLWKEKNNEIADVKRHLRTTKLRVTDEIKADIADYSHFRKRNANKIRFSKDGLDVDMYYDELCEMFPNFFYHGYDANFGSLDVPGNQLRKIESVANQNIVEIGSAMLDDATIQEAVDIITNEVNSYKNNLTLKAAEDTGRESLDSIAPAKATQITNGMTSEANLLQSLNNHPVQTVEQKIAEKLRAVESELADNKQLRRESEAEYNSQIAKLTEEYVAKKDKNSKVANDIVRRVLRLERLKASVGADYAKRISDLETRAEKIKTEKYQRAMHKQDKMQEHAEWAKNLLGDTSTWVDKKLGLQYSTNTERRNLRDIVRDADGNNDIARADAINDALNGQYNREQAEKNRELAKTRQKYADLKITNAESEYIQMLGEFRHNPDTSLTEKVVNEYYEKHKNKIDKDKVDKVIDLARQDYDSFLERVNAKLREQGMKEIPYRKGYWPHHTDPKQNFIQKLFNWKVQNNDIPTSIAGLTEDFKPVKSWQSFDKTRHSDTTDYNFLKGFDAYADGALDWIYHLDTLQKRRAVENHIRFTHSDEGIQARIKEVYANEDLDADEAQAQIEHILAEAKNPLNNFVQDFMTHTNILAGKKNSLDRAVEQATNRQIYNVMTNVQNRMSANMVLANVRSALTNFIPITQSWAQVSPLRSLEATKDTIANAIKDDGLINKSTFLTNRLREADNLYKTNWDKVLDTAGVMFEVVDNFSSQVIWRSKYNQNLAKGMTEADAIANADQFAENVMAGRSKGNEPTLFNAKNPLVKAFTMFQLEVNNQYGYLFKDVPNDLKAETKHWKLNLAKGFTTAFIGAHIYNELLTKLSGSGAALDPIGIIKDLLRDLGMTDEEEEKEPHEVVTNLVDNVVEELPFVGGLFGGGRIPISSALPYGGEYGGGLSGAIEDISKGDWKSVGKEMMNPLLNIGLPVGGGQLKKSVQGLKMFNTDEDHPIAGSYTDSGDLRFPVKDTLGNRIKAGIFGQWANENARDYIENGRKPLNSKQTKEFMDVDLPIADYWKYRDGLKGLKTNAEKADYINSLDIKDWQKNLLMNNILDRKDDVDMSNYDDYGSFEEFDYAEKNPEKYAFFKANGISYKDYANADEDGKEAYTWAYNNPEKFTMSKSVTDDVIQYKQYTNDLYNLKADKDRNGKSINGSRKEKVIEYVNNLDIDYGAKLILFKSEYPSDDTYNEDIISYINNLGGLTYKERITIYEELGFTVKDGYVYWD